MISPPRRRSLLVFAAVASVTALGLSGCVNVVEQKDLELGASVTIEPSTSQASDDTRVTVGVTEFERVTADEVATWNAFDSSGKDVYRATADLQVEEGTYPEEGANGFENRNWGLMVDGEVVKPDRLNGALLLDEGFRASCPLYDYELTPALAEDGTASACLILTAPAGSEPTHVVFDGFRVTGRYTSGAGEASWLVDAS
ncbi:hypothetical protein ES689_07690 [Frigoribacterium sp. ACAM 257]|uniref:hypothetical protein n=1 Tax=Frigoribacterium sp. ACAM 257 TaxID=2508998 RepID=UPI0011B9A174|nr:hypothetical protein [Frigoribacterium sp. ACAM 257]TWX38507.1 hypothetical protein ES689_07690 [Frigoribacterium sp. ACAM 257]